MINTKIVITLVLVGLCSLCKAYIACFDVFEGHRGFGDSIVLRLRTILEDLSLTLNMAKSGALANSSPIYNKSCTTFTRAYYFFYHYDQQHSVQLYSLT